MTLKVFCTGACTGPEALYWQQGFSLMPAYQRSKTRWRTAEGGEDGEEFHFWSGWRQRSRGWWPEVHACVCSKGEQKRNGGLFSSLTGQLQHLTDLPLKLEITSASYGNCLVCLLSHYPTQREDACLLKGLEQDVYISTPSEPTSPEPLEIVWKWRSWSHQQHQALIPKYIPECHQPCDLWELQERER